VGGEICIVPFDQVIGGIRGVDCDGDTVATGRDLGICFGDEPEDCFLGKLRSPVAAQ
jgi:6-phosphofructokinase 1